MTDERPISAWCRKYLESLEETSEVSNGHDCGDEDPNAWSDD